MRYIFIATIFFSVLFLSLFVFSQSASAQDAECLPPYSGFGMCFPASGNCNISCNTTYPHCVYSAPLNQNCCYAETKVGNACTEDTAGDSGKCNEQGVCIVVCTEDWRCADPSITPCGVTPGCIDLNACGTTNNKPNPVPGTSCPAGQTCQGGSCIGVAPPPTGQAPHINNISPTSGLVGQDITITGSNFNPNPFLNYVYFDRSGLITSYAGISGNANSFITKVPQSTVGTAIVSVKSFIGGVLTDSDNSVSFVITGGALPPPTCLSRFGACTTNSQCCSNECSSFSRFCYDSSLSGGGGFICYDNSECSSGSCVGLAPGIQGICSAPPPGGGPPPGPGPGGGTAFTITNPLKFDTLEDLLNAIINFIFWISMAIAPIMFIIAGFIYVTAAGNPQRLTTAKNIMLYTAIGLFVLLIAKGLVVVLKSILEVKST